MGLPTQLQGRLTLPLIGSPMFIVSNPDLVIAQCKAGIVGSMPALNARPQEKLHDWLCQIEDELADFEAKTGIKPAPYAINQICHVSNSRLEADMQTCIDHKVPIIITSLRPPKPVIDGVHSYGGVVFHDVINSRHAQKAASEGVDGLILVCSGAGGHAGTLSPFPFVQQTREWFDGTIILSGAMATGSAILAARAMGADLAYMGTRFINTIEANADDRYHNYIMEAKAEDIIYSNLFSGIHGNYIAGSIEEAGFDPHNLPAGDKSAMDFAQKKNGSSGLENTKAWKDILGAGQGVGQIHDVLPTADLIERMKDEYNEALEALKSA